MAQPNRKGGLDVMIAVGKHKPGLGPMTPVEKRGQPTPQDPDADDDQDQQQGGTVGPEDVDYSDNDLCETCANMGQDGNCSKYGFPVDRTGHCEAGYEPADGGRDQSQPSDQYGAGGDQDQGGEYGQ